MYQLVRKLKGGELVRVVIPPSPDSRLVAQDIPVPILYEDDAVMIVDKPAGLVVHPAPGNPDMTLVNALIAHCGETLSGIGGLRTCAIAGDDRRGRPPMRRRPEFYSA